jgi:signal transduction histidine kinase
LLLKKWLLELAELLQAEARPEQFLAEAVAALQRLPAVSGASWRAGAVQGVRGERTPHAVEFAGSELNLTIYSRFRLGPALQWHLHLLAQVLAEFYIAKLREAQLREASYLQAVHETGARTTHDIKNLLQSLNVLCSVAGRDEYRDSAQLQGLVRRQLPMVAQRLSETLERLQHPEPASESYVPARGWWEALARQYRGEGIEFQAVELPAAARLPRSLFDSVADNLIGNALAKRAAERDTRVRVTLGCAERIALRVCDSGSAVPPEIDASLLRTPVP